MYLYYHLFINVNSACRSTNSMFNIKKVYRISRIKLYSNVTGNKNNNNHHDLKLMTLETTIMHRYYNKIPNTISCFKQLF